MKIIRHKFVEYIPEQSDMEDGVAYISFDYDTVVHNCLCGCGQQVVTPLSPTDWKLTYNGESVSLYPSIGNWEFPCKSHYWIKENKIIWAEAWSEQRIKIGKEADFQAKDHYYQDQNKGKADAKRNLLQKLKSFFIKK